MSTTRQEGVPDLSFEPHEVGELIVRRLRPATRRPSEPPRWEVFRVDRVIGWIDIDLHRLRGSVSDFYFAIGVHLETGTHYRLEGSTDFTDRLEVLRLFDIDPMTSRQHLGLGLMPAYRPPGEL